MRRVYRNLLPIDFYVSAGARHPHGTEFRNLPENFVSDVPFRLFTFSYLFKYFQMILTCLLSSPIPEYQSTARQMHHTCVQVSTTLFVPKMIYALFSCYTRLVLVQLVDDVACVYVGGHQGHNDLPLQLAQIASDANDELRELDHVDIKPPVVFCAVQFVRTLWCATCYTH